MNTNGTVAAEHPLDAMAGFEVLHRGGNAIDAAVANVLHDHRGRAASGQHRRRGLQPRVSDVREDITTAHAFKNAGLKVIYVGPKTEGTTGEDLAKIGLSDYWSSLRPWSIHAERSVFRPRDQGGHDSSPFHGTASDWWQSLLQCGSESGREPRLLMAETLRPTTSESVSRAANDEMAESSDPGRFSVTRGTASPVGLKGLLHTDRFALLGLIFLAGSLACSG